MSDELKPCPFCGAKAQHLAVPAHEGDDNPNAGGEFIECQNPLCQASTALIFPLMESVAEKLAERWNRRAAAPEPPAPGVGELCHESGTPEWPQNCPCPKHRTAERQAPAISALRAVAMAFLTAYEEQEDADWSAEWRALADRARHALFPVTRGDEGRWFDPMSPNFNPGRVLSGLHPSEDGDLVPVRRSLLRDLDEALQRHIDGHAPRQIPVHRADSDILQAELRVLIGRKSP